MLSFSSGSTTKSSYLRKSPTSKETFPMASFLESSFLGLTSNCPLTNLKTRTHPLKSNLRDHKIRNFHLLLPTMTNLSIKFDSLLVEKIINEHPGVSLNLLYHVKMVSFPLKGTFKSQQSSRHPHQQENWQLQQHCAVEKNSIRSRTIRYAGEQLLFEKSIDPLTS